MDEAIVTLPGDRDYNRHPAIYMGIMEDERGDLCAIVKIKGETLLRSLHPSRVDCKQLDQDLRNCL